MNTNTQETIAKLCAVGSVALMIVAEHFSPGLIKGKK